MIEFESFGRLLLGLGALMIILGGVVLLMSRLSLDWNSIPGNINIQGENFACFAPLGFSCLISIVGTVVLNLLLWLANR